MVQEGTQKFMRNKIKGETIFAERRLHQTHAKGELMKKY